jgi:outer membrane scaffolding protein for murein synthesis (MipA/OmpV family)
MTALTPRWIAFANLGASRLLQDAAASPLTRQATESSAGIGLAYRCCN